MTYILSTTILTPTSRLSSSTVNGPPSPLEKAVLGATSHINL